MFRTDATYKFVEDKNILPLFHATDTPNRKKNKIFKKIFVIFAIQKIKY